ncbi:MAG: tetratricopeptide repeat protein, partial [bacterium]|nr:tetratricopeptide repeat protein [bacterium]
LLLGRRFSELLAQISSPDLRGQLLAEVVGVLDAGSDASTVGAAVSRQDKTGDKQSPPQSLLDRQLSIRATGDYSWGLLDAKQRRDFLVRDTRLLRGGGTPDAGAAQLAALKRLRGELQSLYGELKVALRDDDLDWLLPLSENLASLLEITGDFETMRERYAAMLGAAGRIGSGELELHARLGLAVAHSRLGNNGEAQAEAETAVRLAANQQNDALKAAALHLSGSARAMQGDYAGAREQMDGALALRRKLGDTHGLIATMSNLAFVEQYSGNAAAARNLLLAGLETCRSLGELRGEAMFLQNLAASYYNAGENAAAAEAYEQAVAIQRLTGDRRGEGAALSGCGFARYSEGAFADARELHEQALAISREVGDRYIEYISLIVLGNLDFVAGEYAPAAELYQSALVLCREMANRQGEARSLCGMANAAQRSGDHAASARQLAEALRLFIEIADTPGLIDSLNYAAAILSAQPDASLLDFAALALRKSKHHATLLGHSFDPVDLLIQSDAAARTSGARDVAADQPMGLLPLATKLRGILEGLA